MREITGYINIKNELLDFCQHENGIKPLKSPSGRYLLNFNGRIYNHKKLAEKLKKEKNITCSINDPDTEILMQVIEIYGLKAALTQCKGMFALALYDLEERTLYLARDRAGEKPLYYGLVNENFVFAPDINSIKDFHGFNNQINTDVLSLYFIHGYVPAPYSIYQGIKKLDAGMILELKAPFTEHKIYPYWSMKEAAAYGQKNLFKGSYNEAVDELERLLKSAVSEQMAADVPVGAFLSAGIDSTTIVSLMQSLSTQKIKSFTIGMPSYANDEAIHAKKIADHLGLEHTEQYISEQDAKAIIPLLSGMFGEPFADSSQIPTYLVSKIASEHVSIALGGDAGDELFCGYNSYSSVERAYKKLKLIPYFIRRPLSRLLLNGSIPLSHNNRIRANLLNMDSPAELYINSLEYSKKLRKISLTDANIPYKYTELDFNYLKEPNHQLMLMDMLMYTPDDIMVKVERTAAAAGLETRAPMLDKDFMEFAWSLPINFKRDEKTRKVILKDMLYRYVPRELMEREKQGFGIPIEKWLKEPELKAWAEQLIDRDTLKRQNLLNPDVVHQFWHDFIFNDRFVPQVWYILMFQSFMLEN